MDALWPTEAADRAQRWRSGNLALRDEQLREVVSALLVERTNLLGNGAEIARLRARVAELEAGNARVRALCDNVDVYYERLTATISSVDVRTALDAVPAAETTSGEA